MDGRHPGRTGTSATPATQPGRAGPGAALSSAVARLICRHHPPSSMSTDSGGVSLNGGADPEVPTRTAPRLWTPFGLPGEITMTNRTPLITEGSGRRALPVQTNQTSNT